VPTGLAIDIGSPFFWVFLAAAIGVLMPLTEVTRRRRALATANVTFIGFLARPEAGIAAIGFAVLIHGAAVAPTRWKRMTLTGAGSLVAVLFVVHKVRALHPQSRPLASVWPILAVVGFSYVALRAIELLRAGAPRDGRAAGTGWLDAINYLFPFHMLAAGPIQSWDDFLAHQTPPPRLMPTGALAGIERIVTGMFKKFVLARAVELMFLTGFRAPWPYVLIEIQMYYLWVYLDFSAYSDIAVGAGRLLGVHTPENFRHPLVARNMVEFWERWHISLSSFIRRNIFIPVQVGLMRRTSPCRPTAVYAIAISVTFILCGLWHGLSLRYVLWGASHSVALIVSASFGRWQMKRLGAEGVATYRANVAFRIAATALTFEFVALSLALIAHPSTAFLE
jgi:D-alanyl-lipoteichoic acid acyltransferase DltB (MBOAT superfamily)